MKRIVSVKIDKLKVEGSYLGVLKIKPFGVEEEFHGEDLRTIWDKLTFRLLDYEIETEGYQE